MVGMLLSVGKLLAAQNMTTGRVAQISALPLCNCAVHDPRCRDVCSGRIPQVRRGEARVLGNVAHVSGPTDVKRTEMHRGKPFIEVVEKNISRKAYDSSSENRDVVTDVDVAPRRVLEREDNTILYNGAVYKFCDLYDWANRNHVSNGYMGLSRDLRMLYDHVRDSPRISRFCMGDTSGIHREIPSISVPSRNLEFATNTDMTGREWEVGSVGRGYGDTGTENPMRVSPRRLLSEVEMAPIVVESVSTKTVPIFIREPSVDTLGIVEVMPAMGQVGGVHVASGATSTVTLKTTTTTTKTVRQTQTARDENRVMTTTTILKTIFQRQKRRAEDLDRVWDVDRGVTRPTGVVGVKPPPVLASSLPGTVGLSDMEDLRILERIKSLVNGAEARSSASGGVSTTTMTVEKKYTTTVYKDVSQPRTSVVVATRDDSGEKTFELVRSMFKLLKEDGGMSGRSTSRREGLSMTPASMIQSSIELISSIIKKRTTTSTMTLTELSTRTIRKEVSVFVTTTRREERHLQQSVSSSSVGVYGSPGGSHRGKDDNGKYESEIKELRKRLVMNEEKEQGLMSILVSMDRKNEAEEDLLELLKKLYKLGDIDMSHGVISTTSTLFSNPHVSLSTVHNKPLGMSNLAKRDVDPGNGDVSPVVHTQSLRSADRPETRSTQHTGVAVISTVSVLSEAAPAERMIFRTVTGGIRTTTELGTVTEYKTSTTTVSTTVVKEPETPQTSVASSAVRRGDVRDLEDELGKFSRRMDDMEKKLEEPKVLLDKMEEDEDIPPVVRRSVAGDEEATTTSPSVSSSTVSRTSAELSKESIVDVDDIVEKIKERAIPDESLLISDGAVIDKIVEKLEPLMDGIHTSSVVGGDRVRRDGAAREIPSK